MNDNNASRWFAAAAVLAIGCAAAIFFEMESIKKSVLSAPTGDLQTDNVGGREEETLRELQEIGGRLERIEQRLAERVLAPEDGARRVSDGAPDQNASATRTPAVISQEDGVPAGIGAWKAMYGGPQWQEWTDCMNAIDQKGQAEYEKLLLMAPKDVLRRFGTPSRVATDGPKGIWVYADDAQVNAGAVGGRIVFLAGMVTAIEFDRNANRSGKK